MRWGVDLMMVAINDRENDLEVVSGVTALREASEPSAPESRLVVQESSGDSPVCKGEGLTDLEIEQAKEENQRKKQIQESRKSRVILLPHVVLLKLMKSPRAMIGIFLSLVWGLAWIVQETTVVLHMNRVWGLDSHQAGIAFLASIVPTVFCESGAFSFSV